MKKAVWTWLPLLLAAAVGFYMWALYSAPKAQYSMFSWDSEIILEENRSQLMDMLEKAQINEIYQEFAKEQIQAEAAGSFFTDMRRHNTKVYALIGKAQWALEPDGKTLVGEIEAIAKANQESAPRGAIAGVMVDVEPYVLDEWDGGDEERKELMQSYMKNISAAYESAKKHGLELLVCIPTFYDITCPEVLETLIAQDCDGIAVMNYNRENEYKQMKAEVELARQYDKRVICIYELQAPGKHDLTDINTYYNTGLEVLWASRRTLEKQFDYEKLSFSYHYYKPLLKLLESEEL